MSTHPSAVRRTMTPAALVTFAFVAASACTLVLLTAAVLFIRPSVHPTPTDTAATVGGLHYDVNNAWILDPQRPVEAGLVRGLPSADTKPGSHRLLFAVFLDVANETGRRLPMATSFVLQDSRDHEYAPTPLSSRNTFAYRPRLLAPKTHLPGPSTPAGRYLTAGGSMLVFRIPRKSYDDGGLALVVHDPLHPASVRTIEAA